ncbi:hypothetical protein [Luteolibacter soli]|uniref:Uncharacterized protein n=1 Tax=Luteolibacter soli TaxID=3135280 RepID=A0ABU9AT58_9BACT
MSPSTVLRVNKVALILLIAALVCWVAFHFLTIGGGHDRGWEIWREIVQVFKRSRMPGWRQMIAISGFLMLSFLVSASPFAIPLLRSHRLFWWLAVLASGAALAGFGTFVAGSHNRGYALDCLLASMVLNFAGLLCIRRLRPE